MDRVSVETTTRTAKTRPSATSPVRLAVIGCGNWGKNLVREFYQLPNAELVYCGDARKEPLVGIKRAFPRVRTVTSIDRIFSDESLEAIVIATPAVTHAELTERALKAGKHVFVEKPIALVPADVQRCPDITVTKRVLSGWKPVMQLSDGLQKTIAWFVGREGRGRGADAYIESQR